MQKGIKYSWFLLCGWLSLWSLLAIADTQEDGRFWLNINAVGKLPAEGWHWYAELQPRWRHEGSEFDQLLIRPAVYYALNDRSSVWLGYAHVNTHPAGRSSFEENRLWQQYLHNFEPIYDVKIQSRTRLEQRWLENSDDTGYKLRQLVRLTTHSSLHPKLTWVVYDEYFINLNTTDYGARKGFDQNRAFIGVNWALSQTARVEVGYLNQFVNGRNVNAENHVLSTTLNLNF
jgi:Protein of unknown function (DUF2490)